MLWYSLLFSGSESVFLDVCVEMVISLTSSLLLCVLHLCLSESCYNGLYWFDDCYGH